MKKNKKNMVVRISLYGAPHYNSWHIVDPQQIVAVQHRISYVASNKKHNSNCFKQ